MSSAVLIRRSSSAAAAAAPPSRQTFWHTAYNRFPVVHMLYRPGLSVPKLALQAMRRCGRISGSVLNKISFLRFHSCQQLSSREVEWPASQSEWTGNRALSGQWMWCQKLLANRHPLIMWSASSGASLQTSQVAESTMFAEKRLRLLWI